VENPIALGVVLWACNLSYNIFIYLPSINHFTSSIGRIGYTASTKHLRDLNHFEPFFVADFLHHERNLWTFIIEKSVKNCFAVAHSNHQLCFRQFY
jgi:hypothetical protein